MDKSSASIFRTKKFLLPFLSAAIAMLTGALIFILPPPLSTQLHETTADQYQSVTVTPEVAVELDERSAITVTNSEPPSVELLMGNAYFDSNNTSEAIQTLEITVGDVRFLSMGASFSLETLRNGGSIAITNGQLEMNIGGQVHLLSAGQQINYDNQRVVDESSIVGLDVAPWRR
jgi:transmembrane sensor